MLTAARAVALTTRKGHTVPAVQPSTIMLNRSTTEYTEYAAQAQRLAQRFALSPSVAALVLDLLRGGYRNDR